MAVDPIEALVAWLKTAGVVPANRVAVRHRFGTEWDVTTDTAITVTPNGMRYLPHFDAFLARAFLTIYAPDTVDAVRTWTALIPLAEAVDRVQVATTAGNALIYFISTNASGTLGPDPDVGAEAFFVPVTAMIAKEAV